MGSTLWRCAAATCICSRAPLDPTSEGRREIRKMWAQSVRDAFVSLWRMPWPIARRWNSPAWITPEDPVESS